MGTDARWLYLLAGAVVTATVLARPKRPPMAPGAPFCLMGDALADHLSRPLSRIMAEQKHPRVAGNIRPDWSVLDTVMAPQPGTLLLVALGLSAHGGRGDRGSSDAESLARWLSAMAAPAGNRPGQRLVLVAAPKTPHLDVVLKAARLSQSELLMLPSGPCGPDGCTPSLATAGVWSVAVADYLL